MAQTINTNIASLNAQRNLTTSQTALATSLQRLSSGLRINSAKDDAAGLAISERFSTQIRGLNQAVRNANDGISLAQTGEGALAEVTNNLQRIRELAVQATNSTNSISDRAALNLEVQQRLAEIDRTASQTSFNGQKILDGTLPDSTFQVGANAGETITLSLSTSVRTSAFGKIAQATSGVIANAATNGSIGVTPNTLVFGTAGSPATAGQVTFTATTFNFAAAVNQVDGKSATFAINPAAVGGLDFSVTGNAASAKVTTTAGGFTAGDYTASGTAAHFVFTDDSVTGLTIALDGVDRTGGEAAMITAINAQLAAAGSNTVASSGGAGTPLVFTSFETGSGATQPTIVSVGADLAGDGFVQATMVNSGGLDFVANTNATLSVAGTAITLDQDANGNVGTLVTQLNAKIQASGLANKAEYVAAASGNDITITRNGSLVGVAVSATDLEAQAAGFSDQSAIGGTPASAGNPETLTIGGQAITLNQDYTSWDNLKSAIDLQMGAGYAVSNVNGAITVARETTGVTSTAVAITGASGTDGLVNAAGTAGADPVATTNATFYVDGNAVTLNNASYADQAAVASDIQSQLTGYTADYGVTTTGKITIQKTGSLAAVNITGADVNATAAGFSFGSGVAGTSSGSVTLGSGDLTVAGTAIAAGTYTDIAALATYINANASGVYATEGTLGNAGKLVLSSNEAITVGGTEALGNMGFSSLTADATVGSLAAVDVTTAANANTALQRIDSALTSVSTLRSTFGAIQNRFESVITSLSATSENLTSARSRIQDADFAMETAALTRNQILQQAGIAMLAQANSLPQSVLSLLK